jgi:hypothetical protein
MKQKNEGGKTDSFPLHVRRLHSCAGSDGFVKIKLSELLRKS